VAALHGVVERRRYFPAGTGMVLPEGSAGIVHARARWPGSPASALIMPAGEFSRWAGVSGGVRLATL
jgi:hypothetical protein